ncbi:hypothetical protein [Erwinia rhapontici]|uniref:hypothetical protein n=1 Tax=Erwinia rhapontici TaxID=55212 RepID=UPI001D87FBCD|nr:hypothetical protein [Erwinia rhapontici]MBP2156688.1 hypothetical protein [Erwinia rhapontici]
MTTWSLVIKVLIKSLFSVLCGFLTSVKVWINESDTVTFISDDSDFHHIFNWGIKFMKKLFIVAAVLFAGCSSQASRLASCEAQGISRDACYLAEQNRQAAIVGAAENQALRNASTVKFHAQSAHKVKVWKGYGVVVKQDSLGIVSVEGKPAVLTESAPNGTKSYQQGLFDVVFYPSGKVWLIKSGVVQGALK